MRIHLCVALAIIAALASGCSEQGTTPMNDDMSLGKAEPRITSSLQSLLQRSGDDEAWIIIQEEATSKFVQFAGLDGGVLLLDLPVQTLSPEEHVRAQQLLLGLAGSAETEFGFEMKISHDTEKAAGVAIRVLREVYLFEDDVELTLIEN